MVRLVARSIAGALHMRVTRISRDWFVALAVRRDFRRELDSLRQAMLVMGGLVEEQIQAATIALLERDSRLAREVIERDQRVNHHEVDIDEQCVRLLGRPHPEAGDLRFITTAMKIVTEIELIGDQAVSIARRVPELNEAPQL